MAGALSITITHNIYFLLRMAPGCALTVIGWAWKVFAPGGIGHRVLVLAGIKSRAALMYSCGAMYSCFSLLVALLPRALCKVVVFRHESTDMCHIDIFYAQ